MPALFDKKQKKNLGYCFLPWDMIYLIEDTDTVRGNEDKRCQKEYHPT